MVFLLARRDNRNELVITSKVYCFMEDMHTLDPKRPNTHALSRKHILDAVEGSLKRLQTDYIDLYQVISLSVAIFLYFTQHKIDIVTMVTDIKETLHFRFISRTQEHLLPKKFARWTSWFGRVKFGMSEPGMFPDGRCRRS